METEKQIDSLLEEDIISAAGMLDPEDYAGKTVFVSSFIINKN